MGLNWNRKYTTIAAYILIVICLSLLFMNFITRITEIKASLDQKGSVFIPFLIGGVIAYLLNFVLKFYETKILKVSRRLRTKRKLMRGCAIFLTYFSVGIIGYAFLYFIFPQLSEGITNFIEDFPDYTAQLTDFINGQLKRLNLAPEHVSYINERLAIIIESFVQVIKNIVPILLKNIVVLASSVWNVVIGIIVSIYLLGDKERFLGLTKKLIMALFNKKNAHRIIELAQRANWIFGRFLAGTVIDSVVVAVLTLVLLFVFKIPYAVLVAFLVGISNVIPFFGPFIGAVPSAIMIFFVSPIKALWFIIIIIVIQQVDGNIIAPKILGESIGLTPFWVLFSTLIFGNLFGIIGMIIGVPLFAFIYSIVKDVLEARLIRKSLSTDTEHYQPQKKPD